MLYAPKLYGRDSARMRAMPMHGKCREFLDGGFSSMNILTRNTIPMQHADLVQLVHDRSGFEKTTCGIDRLS